MRALLSIVCLFALGAAPLVRAQGEGVTFDLRTVRSGRWSEPGTWSPARLPRAGDRVQVRAGHSVTYDVDSPVAIRMVHVAGTLRFARDRNTRLEVGLLKVQAGETATEDGFTCDAHAVPAPVAPGAPVPTLEVGTPEQPIPAGVTACIRLVWFPGMDRETLPAVIDCAGRWDIHGAPMNRTWVKLGRTSAPGEARVTLGEPVAGWKAGDRVLVTASRHEYSGRSFRRGVDGAPGGQSEVRIVAAVNGPELTLDQPLRYAHWGEGEYRSEVANLSRNVVVESADPAGVRGHTMYHLGSSGGISYAEFRHLGKEGVLGKYAIHFHQVRGSMSGSGVLGASIWDSANRWVTIHGTDRLLIRDCVGYQSVGHGFFLEDGTEQYNVLDRNLAVQAWDGKPLPRQVIPLDANDGAGFWWANGRNTFTRNVSCENDHYGYHFEVGKRSNFDPVLALRLPDGTSARQDVRTLPFLRFEGNESHSEGLYSFNFGDDVNPSVRGDRAHPFIVRSLKAWQTHYGLRPNLQFLLVEGLDVKDGVYGVYHPDYDAHVYRNIRLKNVVSEPINRGHDDDSIQYGSFTYDGLTVEDCRVGRDPLIQMACTSPRPGQAGHFRNVTITNSRSNTGVVDLGGGPRNPKLENGVAYYFHGYPSPGRTVRVVSARYPEMQRDGAYGSLAGFTGPDVRAAEVPTPGFPELLAPVDDLAPASLVTAIRRTGSRWLVRGVTQDNGTLRAVVVNGKEATLTPTAPGVTDWEIVLDRLEAGRLEVSGLDAAGNREAAAAIKP